MAEYHPFKDIPLLQEPWAEYGVGVTVILLRFFVRGRLVGLRGLQGDDYMSIMVPCSSIYNSCGVLLWQILTRQIGPRPVYVRCCSGTPDW